MSTTDSKFEKHRDTEGPARRTYASLFESRGFRHEGRVGGGTVSISPMAARSFWRHVEGTGKPTSRDAMYEEVTP